MTDQQKKPFSDASVRALPLPPKGSKIHFDPALSSFGVRVTANGARTYVLAYRVRGSGRQRLCRIGFIENWTIGAARKKVKELRRHVDNGGDRLGDLQSAPVMTLWDRIAAKCKSMAEQGITPKAKLYRHFGPDSALLYVGVTKDAIIRTAQHMAKARGAHWRDQICQIIIEPFASREEAIAAEKVAISEEFPRYNFAENRLHVAQRDHYGRPIFRAITEPQQRAAR